MAARPLRLGEVRPRAERGPVQRAPVANHGCQTGSACSSARRAAERLSGTPSGGFAGPWRPPKGRHIRLCLCLAGAQDVGRQRARAAPRSSARAGWLGDPGFRSSSHAVGFGAFNRTSAATLPCPAAQTGATDVRAPRASLHPPWGRPPMLERRVLAKVVRESGPPGPPVAGPGSACDGAGGQASS